jgi:hypothetical protein
MGEGEPGATVKAGEVPIVRATALCPRWLEDRIRSACAIHDLLPKARRFSILFDGGCWGFDESEMKSVIDLSLVSRGRSVWSRKEEPSPIETRNSDGS